MTINKHGGMREGAGRPRKKKTVSEKVKANYTRAANKLKREHNGETIEYTVLKLLYQDDIQDSVKVGILKAYNEAMITKETETDINVKISQGPQIYLPEPMPDPAKLIPDKEDKP